MKTIEEILLNFNDKTLDGRQSYRLAQFLTVEQCESIGLKFVSEEAKAGHSVTPFTRENVLAQLEKDVAFGFEKALNRRGLSSGMMYECVHFWNCVLAEGLETFDRENNYAMYGLPLFKATAVKYGWENPIGDDTGSEDSYNDSYED